MIARLRSLRDNFGGLKRSLLTEANDYFAKYFSSGAWMVAANVVIGLAGFVSLMLFSRLLGQDAFGKYKFLITILGLLSVFSLQGMSNAILRWTAESYNASYVEGSKARLKYSIFGSASLVVATLYFFSIGNELWIPSLVAVFFFPFMYSFDSMVFYLYGLQEYRRASIYKTVLNAVPIAVTITVLVLTRSPVAILCSYVVSMAAIYSAVSFMSTRRRKAEKADHEKKKERKKSGKEKSDEEDVRKDMITYGKHISLMNVFSTAYSYLDKIILTYFLGLGNLAKLAIADALPSQYKTHTKFLVPLIVPKLVKNKRIRISNIYPHIALSLLISAAGIAALYIIMPWLITFFFTTKYADSVSVARLIIISAVFWIPIIIMTSYLDSRKMIREMYVFQTATPIVGIATYVVLIKMFGLDGIGYAMILTQAISFALLLVLTRRKAPGTETKLTAKAGSAKTD
ncbi:oligosaccharide flippase family protein [Candidatus Woesearchaeota archaeon]|nr:oligosaccharide flippase family protein [Candidatus Woesearchaeota archaeon]